MPRILPRLAREVEKHTHKSENFPFCRPIKTPTKPSLYKPPGVAPSFHPSHHERSILLASPSPVCDTRAYVRHKRRPPNLVQHGSPDKESVDPPRQMSDKEREWWANPYLRMLSSPLRTCVLTNRTLPSDLLIRLVGMSVPSAEPSKRSRESVSATLAPDGVLHPKYVSRKAGGGAAYILCWRKAIENFEPGTYKRIAGRVLLPPSLSDYIAHLLRLRVLQELELLTEQLEWAMRKRRNLGDYAPILRRLSKAEWGSISSTGTLPYRGAVAVLVAPRPNRDRVTKERPQPSMSAQPPEDEEQREGLPPVSVLMPNSTISVPDETGLLPPLTIPLYNSISAFPSRSQRAALYDFLTRILAVQRFFKRLRDPKRTELLEETKEDSGKGSHAFVLCSDKQTARKADSAAVALALWRLRMYESEGWAPEE